MLEKNSPKNITFNSVSPIVLGLLRLGKIGSDSLSKGLREKNEAVKLESIFNLFLCFLGTCSFDTWDEGTLMGCEVEGTAVFNDGGPCTILYVRCTINS